MTVENLAAKSTRHTGARIRDRRMAMGLKQADLAARAGISASYLNLIEHNRRRIGGKLLVDLARALGVEPAALTEGPEAALLSALTAAARSVEPFEIAPEIDRIDALAARFPGWAATIAAQGRQITRLEALNDVLGDRLSHDQVLAEGVHELLSTVAAIRSTAAILAEDDGLDPQWRARFHRNLHEEAERLSARATALARHFDADEPRAARLSAVPGDAVERLFERSGHHFAEIERQGADAIPAILAGADGLEDPHAKTLAHAALEHYARDAAALPLPAFAEAAAAVGFLPDALYPLAGGDAARVFRRLASLPPQTGAPDFGLAVTDAAGALLSRKRHPVFSVPRFGAGCPLLPLYRAFGRPLAPEMARLRLPDGTALDAWTVSQPAGQDGSGRPIWQATMLIRETAAEPGTGAEVAIGPGCERCPRAECPARRGLAP